MKSVLISIKEINNRNIESGLKEAELRTKPPQTSTPFKVYTYESGINGRHKVVNEWICDNITTWRICMGIPAHLSKVACVSNYEIQRYSQNGEKNISEMHISNLKIYDKPKELSEFKKPCDRFLDCITCKRLVRDDFLSCDNKITRPPKSYCYVEEIKV